MAALTVWKFPDAGGAESAEAKLLELQKQNLIEIQDAATVSWPAGAKRPRTRQLRSLTGAGALGGMFWGMLFGLIFFIPLIGAAIGAAMGAAGGALTDVGINDQFIDSVRKQITPGTSALFLLSDNAVVDKVHAAFEGVHADLVSTNLSDEQEKALRAAFAE